MSGLLSASAIVSVIGGHRAVIGGHRAGGTSGLWDGLDREQPWLGASGMAALQSSAACSFTALGFIVLRVKNIFLENSAVLSEL